MSFPNIKYYQHQMKEHIIKDLENTKSLKEETLYSLNSGKRLRSIIILAMGKNSRVAQQYALFAEYIHNSSLIIDDLPCMDDDKERRGMPTVHVKYGQSKALLIAYNLIVLSTKLCNQATFDLSKLQLYTKQQMDTLQQMITAEISEHIGTNGVCGGQLHDLNVPEDLHTQPDRKQQEYVLNLAQMKTGSLFAMAFILGWVSSGGELNMIDDVKKVGFSFGLCYQIVDDLRDLKRDEEKKSAYNNICRYFSRNGLIDLFSCHLNVVSYFRKTIAPLESKVLLKELHNYLIGSFRKFLENLS